ncbi:MAG: hypothetical protein ACRENS_11535 [Candidatus Eiseniibacteriota bacterium]
MPRKGKIAFSAADIAHFRTMIAAKQGLQKSDQKALRDQLRERGFFISDFGDFDGGITVAAFDELIANGEITVI